MLGVGVADGMQFGPGLQYRMDYGRAPARHQTSENQHGKWVFFFGYCYLHLVILSGFLTKMQSLGFS